MLLLMLGFKNVASIMFSMFSKQELCGKRKVGMKGIFNLNSPEALAKKLFSDYELFIKNPFDPYLAFNFFITAEHIPDWIGDKSLKKSNAALRVCSHIANGAKHFEVDRHNSVINTEKVLYVASGYVEEGYFEEPLMIYLSVDEAKELGFEQCEAIKIAELVRNFWAEYFADIELENHAI